MQLSVNSFKLNDLELKGPSKLQVHKHQGEYHKEYKKMKCKSLLRILFTLHHNTGITTRLRFLLLLCLCFPSSLPPSLLPFLPPCLLVSLLASLHSTPTKQNNTVIGTAWSTVQLDGPFLSKRKQNEQTEVLWLPSCFLFVFKVQYCLLEGGGKRSTALRLSQVCGRDELQCAFRMERPVNLMVV